MTGHTLIRIQGLSPWGWPCLMERQKETCQQATMSLAWTTYLGELQSFSWLKWLFLVHSPSFESGWGKTQHDRIVCRTWPSWNSYPFLYQVGPTLNSWPLQQEKFMLDHFQAGHWHWLLIRNGLLHNSPGVEKVRCWTIAYRQASCAWINFMKNHRHVAGRLHMNQFNVGSSPHGWPLTNKSI